MKDEFESERELRIAEQDGNFELKSAARKFFLESVKSRYSYNFSWLGRPIIQYPQDIIAVQELIWQVKPDLIIETGIAHGGSLLLSASMLALLDLSEAIEKGEALRSGSSGRMVLGIDIDIRRANREAVENHPFACWIKMIEGSSTSDATIEQVRSISENYSKILVFLDSNHSHDHVLAELRAYADLVGSGGYCVVFDTCVEDLPAEIYADRPWGPRDNPKTAVNAFLAENGRFAADKELEAKLLITVAPDGYLKCLRD